VSESFIFDLFISFSRYDNREGLISELVTRVETEYRDFTGGGKLRVFFEKEELSARDDRQNRILDGIRSSRLLLVCLSPNYLGSEYSLWEVHEYLSRRTDCTAQVESRGPVYFVEVPAWSDKGFEQRAAEWVTEFRRRFHFEFLPWFDEGVANLKEIAIKALSGDADAQIVDPISRSCRVIEAKGNLDRQNEYFTGRRAELRGLREMVALDKVGVLPVISGPDGVGKTTLAIAYGHAFAHEYPGGCWRISCQGCEDLRVAFAGLAGAKDLEFDFTEEEKRRLDLGFERVLGELKQRAGSAKPNRLLLLLDDVDQPKLLEPEQVRRLPRAEWLHIIATTPLKEDELFARRGDRAFLTLNTLPENESLRLFERYQSGGKFPNEVARDTADDIVELFGGFTLALEAAGLFLAQCGRDVSWTAFHDRLKCEGLSEPEIADGEPSEPAHLRRLSAALRPMLERMAEAERMMLSFAALLPSDHVALPWVRVLVAETYPELGQDALNSFADPWQRLLGRLFDLRLLHAAAGNNEVRMHRLVQEIIQLEAGAETMAVRKRELLAYVKARAEFLWDGWIKPEHRWELGSLKAFAWQLLSRGATEGAYLANQAFGPLRNLGKFAEVEPLMRRAMAVEERTFGPNHSNVATCLNNLAALLYDTNRVEEAEPLYRRALAINEQRFGADDPKVATCFNNLAQLLQATNRLEEAEALYRGALAIDEKGFGPNHGKVAVHLNNLAQLLKSTGRLDEAERFYRRALAIDENGLGPVHPRVASHLSNLAQLLQTINRPDEAKALYQRALAIDELSFGPNHPRVATHLSNLALLLKANDQLEEAESLYRRALAIDSQSFGPDHPNVGTDLNNLAALLAAENRLDGAESLMRLMVTIFLRDSASRGHEHPFLQTAVRNYAALLAEMGRSPAQILGRLNELGRPFEINFG
jgi:tetratricopeptide (TPR) repeat protein